MPKISFNAKALGVVNYHSHRNVSHLVAASAQKPVVVLKPGIEAIREGLRLAHIESFSSGFEGNSTSDIDSRK